MKKYEAISITLSCGKCGKETKVLLPIVISEEDWVETKKNFERLNQGEDPSQVFLQV